MRSVKVYKILVAVASFICLTRLLIDVHTNMTVVEPPKGGEDRNTSTAFYVENQYERQTKQQAAEKDHNSHRRTAGKEHKTHRRTETPTSRPLLSPTVGLDMEDDVLVAEVQRRLVNPSDHSGGGAGYNLTKPEKTYFSQVQQDELVAKIFRNKTGGFFLEAGALDGEYLSNTLYLERALNWSGVLIEPHPTSFRKLINKNRRAYKLSAGLAPTNKSSQIKLDLKGNYPELAKLLRKVKDQKGKHVVTVDCFPLFTVLLALGNPIIDLMALDIEGLEFLVLQTIPWSKVRVRLLMIEMNHLSASPAVVNMYLRRQGFKFYKTIGVDAIFYNPKLAQDMLIS